MKKLVTSGLLILSILFTSTLSSCLGSFKAALGLKDWNSSISDNKYINNLVFWALVIIPVYGLFLFGDAIIFNVIEFWTGSNPLGMKAGEAETQQITYKGKSYLMTASQNKMKLADLDGNAISELVYDANDKSWTMNSNGVSQKVISINNIDSENVYCSIFNSNNEAVSGDFTVSQNEIRTFRNVWVMK